MIKPDTLIVDLGCAPGSWSQYAASCISPTNQIVGVDLLPMNELEQVRFIQGDFTDSAIQHKIKQYFPDYRIDLVLSDMSPNITGIRITDQARAEELQMTVLDFCNNTLNSGGNLVTKIFEGENTSLIKRRFKACFRDAQTVKPEASRSESTEVYLVARGFQPGVDSWNDFCDR